MQGKTVLLLAGGALLAYWLLKPKTGISWPPDESLEPYGTYNDSDDRIAMHQYQAPRREDNNPVMANRMPYPPGDRLMAISGGRFVNPGYLPARRRYTLQGIGIDYENSYHFGAMASTPADREPGTYQVEDVGQGETIRLV